MIFHGLFGRWVVRKGKNRFEILVREIFGKGEMRVFVWQKENKNWRKAIVIAFGKKDGLTGDNSLSG